jgi:DegV family protein with EDD domain
MTAPQRRPVLVVTDSTAALPPSLAAELGIVVVPLQVSLGDRTGFEGVDVTSAELAAALADRHGEVRTSQPSPAAFAAAFGLDPGGRGPHDVVAIHLSASMSGTFAAAERAAAAAADAGVRARVVDSRSAAMGLGFPVLAAARAARAGASLEEVVAATEAATTRTAAWVYLHTLDQVRRGGRMGAAEAMFNSALAVKPLLVVRDGTVVPLEKVRTASRALARLEELAVEYADDQPCEVAVHHLAAPDRASDVLAGLRQRLGARLRAAYVEEVGAVLGAHCGPGLLAVVVHRLRS